MLPLNALLEIKSLTASHDGACIAAVTAHTHTFDTLKLQIPLKVSKIPLLHFSNVNSPPGHE
jgi:hypothetical protein